MTNDQCIASSLARLPTPKHPDLLILHLRIFLYRAAADRPLSDFRFPAPEPPDFSHLSYPPGTGNEFDLYLHHQSFSQPFPARFHLDAVCVYGDNCDTVSIHRSGAAHDHTEPQDRALLQSLCDALRSFPLGWTLDMLDS